MTDTPDAIPAEAIEAGNRAIRSSEAWPEKTFVRLVLSAAAPVIAARATAAERERILGDDSDDPAASVYRLGIRHGKDAERDRIRQLAIHHRVGVRIRHNDDGTITHLNRDDWYPFADLLGGASRSAQTAPAAPGSVPKVTGPETSHHDVSVDRGDAQHHPCQCRDCT